MTRRVTVFYDLYIGILQMDELYHAFKEGYDLKDLVADKTFTDIQGLARQSARKVEVDVPLLQQPPCEKRAHYKSSRPGLVSFDK